MIPVLAILTGWLAIPVDVTAQAHTQTITLQPGWNAVWLEVRPEDDRSSAVFSQLPVASVWTRLERLSSVDFIQSASEAAFNEAGWQRWFPPSREESFLNNLFAVQANHAYLIKSTNPVPVIWNLTGRPSLRQPDWVPDAFNLRGLPVDPTASPTFLGFFSPSAAHYDSAAGQLQPVYRLNSGSAQWEQVAPGDSLQSGAAYWIFTRGASDYLAPLNADVDLGDGLDFGDELTQLNLHLKNWRSSPINALITEQAGGASSILSHYNFDPVSGGQWPALPAPLPQALGGGSRSTLRLAARRQDMSAGSYDSILEVRDGAGTRLLIPVHVEDPAAAVAPGAPNQVVAPSDPLAGLWVGSATLKAVSEAHSADPTTPTPVNSALSLRLLVHVDATGQARLLKEVLQMWKDGTYTNDTGGNLVADQPGQYVLLTDDTLIPFFGGATVRDGESVGRRLSSVGYDFPSTATNNYLELAGSFSVGNSLSGTLTLPYDYPTNPFYHRYHPDHDNLNARFDGPLVEAYTTTRQIALQFLTSPPDGPAVPDFGYNEMGGTYSETITGIHKYPIHVSGTFRLTRVSLIANLNPSPNL